ncbi:tyrosine-protein kinase [uncultured Bacteroides sp.]|uniref:GumC family protein n=1 Tax=uncultured Bacteroides sp. TaxID=162156 RepID=UPI00261B5315|nr:tyrosine-protein kinase [uncultured Bacteroides sp.]
MEEAQEKPFNIYEIVFKYLVYWPWFIISVIFCMVFAFIYLRYSTPVYTVDSKVLIKETDSRSQSAGSALMALQDMGGFSMTSNFDNEVEILKSVTLAQKVVTDMGLYISTYLCRTFGYDMPLYNKNTPLNVYMNPLEAEKLKGSVSLDIKYTVSGQLSVKGKYNIIDEEYKIEEQSFSTLPAVLTTPVGVITISKNETYIEEEEDNSEDVHLRSVIVKPLVAAQSYSKNLTVDPTSKTTTIAAITLQTGNTLLGIDYINNLIRQYNNDANDEKNQVASKTAEFIDERLAIINKELGSTETEMAEFKQRAGVTDVKTDAQLVLEENTRYEQQRIQNSTQINLVEFLKSYINNPANANEVIPANVGLEDQGLTSVISQYNTMLIERKRLLRTSSESNPAVINLNTGIEAMRTSVQTSVESVLEGLKITKADLDRKANRLESRISNAPQYEKEFLNISRQQEIKAQLYTILLQKREENAITLAATANNGRIVENPLPSREPVSPKKAIIALAALVLGLGLPVSFIYLRELLKYKIEDRTDIERITDVGILAEIPKTSVPSKGAIVVRENHNNMMEEVFRGLRTNLLFMLEKGQKVIMVSSTQPGEGKSFVAGNLATSLAFLGKKVVIVGMDIRKPGLNRVFNLSARVYGITNYLSNPEEVKLMDMIQHSDVSPNLDILPGGPVPPNPTELVTRDILDSAISQLCEKYDYVILDTAPIGMVPDSAIIGRVADILVYVCRADFTPKSGFEYINVLKADKKFPKLATVLNGIDMSQRKHSYGYGYGRKYGYGRGYGYGYGYGEADSKK